MIESSNLLKEKLVVLACYAEWQIKFKEMVT